MAASRAFSRFSEICTKRCAAFDPRSRGIFPHIGAGKISVFMSSKSRVPVWAVAATSAALLFGLFVVLRLLLSGSAEAAAEATATLHPDDKITIKRRVIVPPPPPPPPTPKISRLRDELKAVECSTVEQTANEVVIRLCDRVAFDSGEAIVKEQFRPLAAKIAGILDKEPGRILVVGHTDNTPMKTVRFPSNWHLSIERAKAVAAILKQGLSDPNRVEVDGKGADVPIGLNSTPEGRAQNRRVEIMIGRTAD